MKYFYTLILALSTLGASAQTHVSQNFLNVRSVAVTNTSSVSNLSAGLTYNVSWTNGLLTFYTNNAGTRLGTTNASGSTAGQSFNILKDVALWTDRNGAPPIAPITLIGSTNTMTSASIYVRAVANSGTVGTLTFTLRPVYDGDYMETGTTKDFTFTYTPVASTVVALATNVPVYLWAGAKKLRCLSIVNSSANASADVNILNFSLNGFVP